jgi:hypothetical protein
MSLDFTSAQLAKTTLAFLSGERSGEKRRAAKFVEHNQAWIEQRIATEPQATPQEIATALSLERDISPDLLQSGDYGGSRGSPSQP